MDNRHAVQKLTCISFQSRKCRENNNNKWVCMGLVGKSFWLYRILKWTFCGVGMTQLHGIRKRTSTLLTNSIALTKQNNFACNWSNNRPKQMISFCPVYTNLSLHPQFSVPRRLKSDPLPKEVISKPWYGGLISHDIQWYPEQGLEITSAPMHVWIRRGAVYFTISYLNEMRTTSDILLISVAED